MGLKCGMPPAQGTLGLKLPQSLADLASPASREGRHGPVLHADRIHHACAGNPVFLVLAVAPLEKSQLGVSLVGQDVRRDAVEEPAVMAYAHHSACKVLDCCLKRAQCVHVKVVGRLVQHEEVPTEAQGLGELQAVPLPPAECGHQLVLNRSLEVEPGAIRPAHDLPPADVNDIHSTCELIKHSALVIEAFTPLVNVHGNHRVAHDYPAQVWLLRAHDHLEECRLPGAVWADDADHGPWRDLEVRIVDQQTVAVALGHADDAHHLRAEPRPRGDDDGVQPRLAAVRGRGVHQLLVPPEPGFALLLPAAAPRVDELKLLLDLSFQVLLPLLLLLQAAGLALQPGRVVALEGDALPLIEFQDPSSNVVQEITVVGDGHYCALEVSQETL
mmetsp:Transcript_43691/g.121432  ORF Transcript_43691/g.121432 Transcript_43691/m.121432 type:complete len:387 (+) Transcript_43691:52-1212(+)